MELVPIFIKAVKARPFLNFCGHLQMAEKLNMKKMHGFNILVLFKDTGTFSALIFLCPLFCKGRGFERRCIL